MRRPSNIALADRQRWTNAGLGGDDTASWARRGLTLGIKADEMPLRVVCDPGSLRVQSRLSLLKILRRVFRASGESMPPDLMDLPTHELRRAIVAKFHLLELARAKK